MYYVTFNVTHGDNQGASNLPCSVNKSQPATYLCAQHTPPTYG